MKLKKRQLKKLILEYVNSSDYQKQSAYDNQYFDSTAAKENLEASANDILKNNKSILEMMIKNISDDDKKAISSFNKMRLQEQISIIVNVGNSSLKELKENSEENLNLIKLDSPEKELYNMMMGNPKGIKNKSQLKKMSNEDIESLANSVSWNRSVRSIGFIIANAGSGLGLLFGPDLIVNAVNALIPPLYNYAGIIIPSFTIPIFSKAALVFFIIAILYSLHQVLMYKFKKQASDYSVKSDREKLEDEIASGLYLDDEEIDKPKVTSYENIKMMIKNIFRFFTQ